MRIGGARAFLLLGTVCSVVSAGFAADEKLTITTYYPSPAGVYKNLRLMPGTDPGDCTNANAPIGKLFFNATAGSVYACTQISAGNYGYRPVSQFWALNAASATVFPVDTSYRVGIGTNSASSILTIARGGIELGQQGIAYQPFVNPTTRGQGPEITFWAADEAHYAPYYYAHNAGRIYGRMPQHDWMWMQLVLQAGNNWNTFVQNQLVLRGNGRVGIGTDNPAARLHVAGDGFVADGIDHTMRTAAQLQDNTVLHGGIYQNSGDGLLNAAGNAVALTYWWHVVNMHHQHNNGFNAQLAFPLSVTSEYYSPYFRTSSGGGWTQWQKILYENQNGRVGIGTNTPGCRFQIAGVNGGWAGFIDAGYPAYPYTVDLGMYNSQGSGWRFYPGRADTGSQVLSLWGYPYNGHGGCCHRLMDWNAFTNRITAYGSFQGTGQMSSMGYNPDSWPSGYGGGFMTWDVMTHGAFYTNHFYATVGWDLAERYFVREKDLAAGEVVSLDRDNDITVKRASLARDEDVFGVVSTKPAVLMGWDWDFKENDSLAPIALAGRVPTRVLILEGSPIMRGDLLASGPVPGYAVKADKSCMTVGKALQETTDMTGDNCGHAVSLDKIQWPDDPKGGNQGKPCFRIKISALPEEIRDALRREYPGYRGKYIYVGKIMAFVSTQKHDPGNEGLLKRIEALERRLADAAAAGNN